MFYTTDIISGRINIIEFTVFPQITNRNLKMKGNGPFSQNNDKPASAAPFTNMTTLLLKTRLNT
jgi:hypothetical protein